MTKNNMTKTKKHYIATLLHETKKHGGLTFTINREIVEFKKGYQVSVKDIHRIDTFYLNDEMITKTIYELLKKLYMTKGDYFVGTWFDDENVLYIDISIYVKDKKEALELAKKHNQKAIFDWDSKTSIYL